MLTASRAGVMVVESHLRKCRMHISSEERRRLVAGRGRLASRLKYLQIGGDGEQCSLFSWREFLSKGGLTMGTVEQTAGGGRNSQRPGEAVRGTDGNEALVVPDSAHCNA